MSKSLTTDDLDKALKTQTDEIINVFQSFMQQVDERFSKVESR